MPRRNAEKMRAACGPHPLRSADAVHAPMPRYGTVRDGTERHASKTPEFNLTSHIARPGDNRISSLADEWLDDFISRVSAKATRLHERLKLRQEQDAITPPAVVAARDYQDETEQLARYLRGQQTPPQIAAPIERIA